MSKSLTVFRGSAMWTTTAQLFSFIYFYLSAIPKLGSMDRTDTSWSSKYSGWRQRANPSVHPFTPTRENFLFAISINAMGVSDGFEVALFKPNIAVDTLGIVLELSGDDFDGFVRLAHETAGHEVWQWRIYSDWSCRPITNVRVSQGADKPFAEAGVYAYEKGARRLEDGGRLPDAPTELFGLAAEVPYRGKDGEKSDELIRKIQELYRYR